MKLLYRTLSNIFSAKKGVAFLVFVFFCFPIYQVQASTFYNQNFDTLNLGNLTGQDSWSGTANPSMQVTDSESFSGSQSLRSSTSFNSENYRLVNLTGSNDFYLEFMAMVTANSGGSGVYFQGSVVQSNCGVVLNTGLLQRYGVGSSGSDFSASTQSISLDTWYYNVIHINRVSNICEVSFDSGATWYDGGMDGTAYDVADFDRLRIYSPNNATFYDDLGIISGGALSNNITNLNNPITTTPSSFVNFNFDYYIIDDTYDYAGIQVQDVISGLEYLTSEDLISATGSRNYSKSLYLNTGNLHQWRAYLRDTSGNFLYSNWESFDVVSSSGYQTIIPTATSTSSFLTFEQVGSYCDENFPIDDSDIISTTLTYLPNGFCRLALWLVIPTDSIVTNFKNITFENKIPFAYFYDLKEIINNATASTADNMPELTLNGGIFGEVVIFSASSTKELMGTTNYNLFRQMFVYGFWLFLAVYIIVRFKQLL